MKCCLKFKNTKVNANSPHVVMKKIYFPVLSKQRILIKIGKFKEVIMLELLIKEVIKYKILKIIKNKN